MLNEYEAVVVFEPDTDDAGAKAQVGKIEGTVSAHGGEIIKRDFWGRRPLAYPIRKKNYGIYVLLNFSGDSGLVADLNRQLRINDAVLRSIVVTKDKFAPDFNPRTRYDAAIGPVADGAEELIGDFVTREVEDEGPA